jgi:16S rRNA (cytosine1402-N4)-methyltransferase
MMSPVNAGHTPVMLEESIAGLVVKIGGLYVDGTFGGGGHTQMILERLPTSGAVIAFDRDPEAISRGEMLQSSLRRPQSLKMIHANFADFVSVWRSEKFPLADGVLLDLGMSSFQLDTPERGFSFGADGPLDMRFDPTSGSTALEFVNEADEQELAEIIWNFGEDQRSRKIAAAIVNARQQKPITTTAQLATVVELSVGGRRGMRKHPATQTFQALRIMVNEELLSLQAGLEGAVEILKPGGRLAVITFHSLEDRLVKRFMAQEASSCTCPPELPICICKQQPRIKVIGKKTKPSENEVDNNARSRSAVLRIAERLPMEADA